MNDGYGSGYGSGYGPGGPPPAPEPPHAGQPTPTGVGPGAAPGATARGAQDPFFGPDSFVIPGADNQPIRIPTPQYIPQPARRPSTLERWRSQGGVLGTLAAVLLAIAKAGAPIFSLLFKFKLFFVLKTFLVTGGSMIASMWFWSMMFGWPFAVGLVLSIFIHECGHAVAAKALGHKLGAMVFIPGCGAVVFCGKGRNVVEDAHVGIMGPVFGTLSGIACLVLYRYNPSTFWLALAHVIFFLNLFNLAPTPPLDGGWITPIFSPKLLALGVVILFVIAPGNPMIWILGFMSLPRIIGGWKAKPTDTYYRAKAADRWKYGLAYVGLAAFLAYGNFVLGEELNSRRPATQQVAMANGAAAKS